MSNGSPGIKVLGVLGVVIAGAAATATLKPDLYKRWLPGSSAGGDDSFASSGTGHQMRFARARKGDLRVSVSEEGKLRAVKSHTIFPQLRGSSRITFLAPEGSTVKKGDLLVSLDKKPFEDQLL